MTEQLKQSLPAVYKVLKDAEELISQMTGIRVKVHVNVTEEHKYHQKLIEIITAYFDICFLGMAGKNRDRDLVTARQIFIYLAYKPGTPGCTSTDLGRLLNRDHSTILHSLTKIKDLIHVQDEYICTSIANIQQILSEYEGSTSSPAASCGH